MFSGPDSVSTMSDSTLPCAPEKGVAPQQPRPAAGRPNVLPPVSVRPETSLVTMPSLLPPSLPPPFTSRTGRSRRRGCWALLEARLGNRAQRAMVDRFHRQRQVTHRIQPRASHRVLAEFAKAVGAAELLASLSASIS